MTYKIKSKKSKEPKIEEYILNRWSNGRTRGYVLCKSKGAYQYGNADYLDEEDSPKDFEKVHKILKGNTEIRDKETIKKVKYYFKK